MSFYNNGFKYFEFMDSDEHLSQTIFNYVQILYSPNTFVFMQEIKSYRNICNRYITIGNRKF